MIRVHATKASINASVDNSVRTDWVVETAWGMGGLSQEATKALDALPKLDALWNHDDDQGVGVLAAIDNAGRDEFFMVGGAGSANAMRAIEAGDSVLEATVIYPHTQAADGIKLARLVAQGKNLADLTSQGVPRRIVLDAPVVTKDNVDQFIDNAFES